MATHTANSNEGLYELRVEDEFAAAHRLRGYEGQCENLHGHNWKIELVLAGRRLNELGMLIDFREARAVLAAALEDYDHTDLNEHPHFRTQNPTTENMARTIGEHVAARLPRGVCVRAVTAWESPRCCVTYRPPHSD